MICVELGALDGDESRGFDAPVGGYAEVLSRETGKVTEEVDLPVRPDRILLAELRSEEAFYYLRNIASGHPGSITSVHAGSCALALEQLVLMVRQFKGGQGLSREDIHALIRLTVDVVIQFGVEGGERYIDETSLTHVSQ